MHSFIFSLSLSLFSPLYSLFPSLNEFAPAHRSDRSNHLPCSGGIPGFELVGANPLTVVSEGTASDTKAASRNTRDTQFACPSAYGEIDTFITKTPWYFVRPNCLTSMLHRTQLLFLWVCDTPWRMSKRKNEKGDGVQSENRENYPTNFTKIYLKSKREMRIK